MNFPLEGLELSNYLKNANDESPVYDLYAISNHYGSLGGGHYTAFCYNDFEKGWIEFNDSTASRATNI